MAYSTSDRRPIVVVEAPAHPVQQLQGPFEESMFESQNGQVEEIEIPLDATTRRAMLLEAPTYQRIIAGRWRQKLGEKYHPLWKLVAQMSFGIHLLAEGMAKSEEDVFQILQTHVDDIDVFLERTTEDFTLAQEDIQERLKCLELPLQHPDVFDRMLEDRTFRNSIVEGNEKIEHIVTRTGCGMKDALKDIQKGYESTSALERYLQTLEVSWVRATPEHEAVFVAMLGNVEGWKRAFLDLHMQGNKLAGSLRKLTEVINKMQHRAGEVSRKLVRQQQRSGGSINGSSSITYISQHEQSSRSSSRQQATPSPLGFKKPLPPPTSRTSTRQQSRADSRGEMYTSRSGTSQSQRSGTSQSQRSGDARSETPGSRTQSRNDQAPGVATDDSRSSTRMNIGTPRVIYVKNHTGHHRANSQTASVRQYPAHPQPILEEFKVATPTDEQASSQNTPTMQAQPLDSTISMTERAQAMQNDTRPSIPVELPAEIPSSVFLQAPMSKINRLSIGLGILPSERRAQAQSKAFNPTTALIELLSDPLRYSKLPVTPSSATSPGAALGALDGQSRMASHLQQAAMREPTPDQTPPKPSESTPSGSTPSTPAWAAQTFGGTGTIRKTTDMTSARSSTPSRTPENFSTEAPTLSDKTSFLKANTSIDEPTGNSSSEKLSAETASVERAPSELSAGYENEMPKLANSAAPDTTMLPESTENTATSKKKLSYIAELEGSLPVFLPSTVYTPISFGPVLMTAHELEAPQAHFILPPRTSATGLDSTTVQEPKTNSDVEVRTNMTVNESGAGDDGNIPIHLEEALPSSVAQTSLTNGRTQEDAEDPSDKRQKTLPPTSPSQTSGETEATADVTHLPSSTPSGSPVILSLRARPSSTGSRNSAMLEDRRITTIYTAQSASDEVTLDLPKPVTLPSESTQDHDAQLPVDQQEDVRSEASPSSDVLKSTAERPKSPFPLIADTGSATEPEVDAHSDGPKTPVSIDLKRSNTKEARSQWKAFFSGQLKSPVGSANSNASTASIGQSSPKENRTSAATTEVEAPILETGKGESPILGHDATSVSFLASPSPDDTDEDPIAKHISSDAGREQELTSPTTDSHLPSYEEHDILNDYA